MKNSFTTRSNMFARTATRLLLGLALAFGTATLGQAQGQLPSGTISSSGSGPFFYSLLLANGSGATSPVGSVWYAWIPGQFFLPGTPTSASAPVGWTATITGDSIKFVADAPADDIAPGQSLSGFSYEAAFSPAQLAAASNSGESDAYSAGLFSDPGVIFTVQPVAAPEPSGPVLMLLGMAILWIVGRRKLAINRATPVG